VSDRYSTKAFAKGSKLRKTSLDKKEVLKGDSRGPECRAGKGES